MSHLITSTTWHLQVGVRARDAVVLGVEKKSVAKLQESRTVKKVVMLDSHVCMTFAGRLAAWDVYWLCLMCLSCATFMCDVHVLVRALLVVLIRAPLMCSR